MAEKEEFTNALALRLTEIEPSRRNSVIEYLRELLESLKTLCTAGYFVAEDAPTAVEFYKWVTDQGPATGFKDAWTKAKKSAMLSMRVGRDAESVARFTQLLETALEEYDQQQKG